MTKLALALSVLAIAASAHADPLPSCGPVTQSMRMVTDCSAPLDVLADEAVIDLGGRRIVCPQEESGEVGIRLVGRRAVTVRNGTIACGYAVVVEGGGSHLFRDLTAGGPYENARAISLSNSNDNRFMNVTADGGFDGRAALVENSSGNTFERVTFTASEFSAVTMTGNRNRVLKSTIDTVLGRAALFVAGNENVLEGNKISGASSESGIFITGADNVIRKNTVTAALCGIEVAGSGAVIDSNEASTMEHGLLLSGTGASVRKNRFSNNSLVDITYLGGGCEANRWDGNRFSSDSEGDGPRNGCIR